MIGALVELHLLNGKRFLGKVTLKDREGLVLYCIPVKALESVPPGKDTHEQLREMVRTVFFPWQNIEYVDIGGEPIGFNAIYASWFHEESLEDFFARSTENEREAIEARKANDINYG